MKKLIKKLMAAAMVTVISTSMLAGCSGKKAEDASTPAKTEEVTKAAENSVDINKEETLKIFIPGDRPAAFDKVIAEAEARMKDTVNVKLDVVFVPWSDLQTKVTQTLNSGEKCDIIFDAPWNGMNTNVSTGYYEPMEDLLAKYGQNILKTTPNEMFEANKFAGKIYGIPLGVLQKPAGAYLVRKDIREALGLPEIKSYQELEKMMYAVKEKYPDMIPFLPQNTAGNDRSAAMMRLYFENPNQIERTEAFGTSHVLYFKNNDGKVYNLFEEMDSDIWSYIENARKLYNDGIIYRDMLAVADIATEAKKGNVAISVKGDIGVDAATQTALKSVNPNYEFETVDFYSTNPGAYTSDFKQWNFVCIPKVSKNKERAMMFLDWVRTDQANYDLLAYGFKGETFNTPDEDSYSFIGTDYTWFPYAWIWNPTQDRVSSDLNEKDKATYQYFSDASNFIPSKLLGFTFNAEKVTNEIAQFNSIEAKYYPLIINGVTDPQQEWDKFKAEASDVVKTIQTEYQAQIDTFLAQ